MIGFYLILVCTIGLLILFGIGWYEKFNKWRRYEMKDEKLREFLGVKNGIERGNYGVHLLIDLDSLKNNVHELRLQMGMLIDALGYEFVRRGEYPEMDIKKVNEDHNVCTCCEEPKVPVPPHGPSGKVGP